MRFLQFVASVAAVTMICCEPAAASESREARPITRSHVATSDDIVPNGPDGKWRLMFHDEFDGSSVDQSKWQFQSTAEADWSGWPFGTGNKGNQQLEFDQPTNCSVAGGTLTITARPDAITSQSGQHYRWSSCLITSTGQNGYAFRYGYVEIKAQLPSDRGFWPAFWTWQAAGNERYTETDVFEFYSDNHTRLYLSQHSGPDAGCVYQPPFDPTADMHVYGADIHEYGTDFYIDGTLVCHVQSTSTGMTNLIVDNFVYSEIPPARGSVGSMSVDYVRAWKRDD
ncbi:glycoside hydrolase family 16 protein [Nonomuraea sediminis]|uniref:glycoside hydrolase family 16 protein n=1 Tax=Nonomuraea sediminis TaxID=2835864 RepID=UPI001BDD1329|nr:glycoside hydrolase family 16 protein [Nonomuraea sediminis]